MTGLDFSVRAGLVMGEGTYTQPVERNNVRKSQRSEREKRGNVCRIFREREKERKVRLN